MMSNRCEMPVIKPVPAAEAFDKLERRVKLGRRRTEQQVAVHMTELKAGSGSPLPADLSINCTGLVGCRYRASTIGSARIPVNRIVVVEEHSSPRCGRWRLRRAGAHLRPQCSRRPVPLRRTLRSPLHRQQFESRCQRPRPEALLAVMNGWPLQRQELSWSCSPK